jgi:hypothetical protein
MPYIIRPKRARRIAATVFSAALLVCAVPAAASAACPSSPSSALLTEYGDNAAYTLLTGSSFESGASGWWLTNAQVSEEEGATGGSNALTIEPGGRAVSPSFCVSSEYPSFRFFARALSASSARGGGSLRVSLLWSDLWGHQHSTTVASLTPAGEWTLSPVLGLATSLPLWMNGATLQVRLEFQANGADSWAIDNVYIDPYSR